MKVQEKIPVFFAVDKKYAPYLSVSISSLKKNASKDAEYEIFILHAGMTEADMRNVESLGGEGFKVSFVDVSSRLDKVSDEMCLRDYYSFATYYRVFIAGMFPEYGKAVYLDSDTVILGDLKELYDTDLKDAYVGAIPDGAVQVTEPFKTYVNEALGIPHGEYFNAGILVMNLDAMRKENFYDKFFALLKAYKFVVAQDQDYLNVLCRGRVKFLSDEWNKMPIGEENGVPKLVHYNLTQKPWHYDVPYSKYFWEYAKDSVYRSFLLDEKKNYTEQMRKDDEELTKNLLALCLAEAKNPENYARKFPEYGNERKIKTLNEDRREILKRIERNEKDGKFDLDVENDPPFTQLMPGEADYYYKNPVKKTKRNIAMWLGKKYYDGMIKRGELVIDGMEGEENLSALKGGAIVTCNHFSVSDNYVLYYLIKKYLPKKRLYKIIREGNYTGFKGLYGFLFKNADTLPLSSNHRAMIDFMNAVNYHLTNGQSVLIYPEQGMWWNYRKPRPFKIGGFKMAVRANVPIVPTFITMTDDEKDDPSGYPVQRHFLHIMPAVYPDPNLPEKARAQKMLEDTFALYKSKYEEVYGVPLSYSEQ